MIIKHSMSAVPSLIPDCCNIGVIYRVLLSVNLVLFVTIWSRSVDMQQAILEFIQSTMLIETISILSLLMLCGCRKVALVQAAPAQIQRALCGIVPVMITLGIFSLVAHQSWLVDELARTETTHAAVLALGFGLVFQHYFEVRNRAFSPMLVEAKLQALQARIRPHFLFNSINAVLSLIRTDPARAESALEDLSDLFRVLMRDTRDMSTLHDEIRLCRQYLSLEKIRLGDRLIVEWEMLNLSNKHIKEAKIASLLLQPLLENAVHHGVEPSMVPSLVSIKLNRHSDRIIIVVENSFHGPRAASGNQMALKNIRERLSLLYDVEAELSTTIQHNLFQVKLIFPYQKAANPTENAERLFEATIFKPTE